MYNYQIAAGRRDDQLTGVRRNTTTQEARCVEHFLVDQSLFCVRIDIPGEYATVETGSDEQRILARVFDVLHPILVAVEAAKFHFKVTCVPERNCCIVRTGGKHTVAKESNRKIQYVG